MSLSRWILTAVVVVTATALFVFTRGADAAAAITVAGVVGHQETNTLMSGVTVKLTGSGYSSTQQTGANGQFSFTAPPGTYSLTVSKAGYQMYPPGVNGDMFGDQWWDFTGSGPAPNPMPTPTPGAPREAWSRYWDGPGGFNEINPIISVDPQGNVAFAAMTFNEFNRYGDTDIIVGKYDRNGILQWTRRIAGPEAAQDQPTDIRTDAAGNVYVTGNLWIAAQPYYDIVTAKFDANGGEQWRRTYNGLGDYNDNADALRVDSVGNVYVTGSTIVITNGRTNNNFCLLKYDPNGTLLWEREWDGGDNDGANELELDRSGNIIVTGTAAVFNGGYSNDIVTVKWLSNGNLSWVNRFDTASGHDDNAYRVELDSNGNPFILGSIWTGDRPQVVLFKLSGATGTNLWTRPWSRSGAIYDDAPMSLTVDRGDNPIITGQTYYGPSDQNVDVFTAKFTTTGTLLWQRIFNGPSRNGFDGDNQVAVDGSNNIYVSMSSQGFNNYDLTLVKYDTVGNQVYSQRFDNDNDKDDLFWGWENGPRGSALSVDGTGNIYMAGHSSRVSPTSGVLQQDIGIVKLSPQQTTAAGVTVSGRVTTSTGTGIRGARVTIGGGQAMEAITNAFGYYTFSNVPVGDTYVFSAAAKGAVFSPQVVSVTDTLTGVDFVATAPQSRRLAGKLSSLTPQ